MGATDSIARAQVYRLLARVFQPPRPATLDALRLEDLPFLRSALVHLGAGPELLEREDALRVLHGADGDALAEQFERSFEPSGGQARPPNETAHAPETPQEGLTRTFELADIAGFYKAFGVEVTPGSERVDHIAAELEFMHLLAAKEAFALERGQDENAATCREAAAVFLRDHLGRWCAKLRSQVEAEGVGELYPAAAALLAGFVELDRSLLGSPAPPAAAGP